MTRILFLALLGLLVLGSHAASLTDDDEDAVLAELAKAVDTSDDDLDADTSNDDTNQDEEAALASVLQEAMAKNEDEDDEDSDLDVKRSPKPWRRLIRRITRHRLVRRGISLGRRLVRRGLSIGRRVIRKWGRRRRRRGGWGRRRRRRRSWGKK